MSEEEIIKCPKCGKDAEVQHYRMTVESVEGFAVCDNCGWTEGEEE